MSEKIAVIAHVVTAYPDTQPWKYLPPAPLFFSLKGMDDKRLEQFLPYVEHCDVSQEMKMQILRDLWSVLRTFSDKAWGNSPFDIHIKKNSPPE